MSSEHGAAKAGDVAGLPTPDKGPHFWLSLLSIMIATFLAALDTVRCALLSTVKSNKNKRAQYLQHSRQSFNIFKGSNLSGSGRLIH